jgi:hypothetical protein
MRTERTLRQQAVRDPKQPWRRVLVRAVKPTAGVKRDAKRLSRDVLAGGARPRTQYR